MKHRTSKAVPTASFFLLPSGLPWACLLAALALGCTATPPARPDCLRKVEVVDSLPADGLTWYAGYQKNRPVLFSMAGGDCGTMVYAHNRGPICQPRDQGFEFDRLCADGRRVAALLYQRSAGVNTATAYILSSDGGRTWYEDRLGRFAPGAEDILDLSFLGHDSIEVRLFSSDGPTRFISPDNGRRWLAQDE